MGPTPERALRVAVTALLGVALVSVNTLLMGAIGGALSVTLQDRVGPGALLAVQLVPVSVGFLVLAQLFPPPRGTFGRPRRGRHWLTIPVGMLALSAALDACLELLGAQGGALEEIQHAVLSTPLPGRFLLLIATAALPALGEEAFFRGTILGRAGLSEPGIALSAVLFGLAHFDPWQSPAAALMGIYLGLMALLTRSIWPGIVAHAFNNGLFTLAPELGDALPSGAVAVVGFLVAGAVLVFEAVSATGSAHDAMAELRPTDAGDRGPGPGPEPPQLG